MNKYTLFIGVIIGFVLQANNTFAQNQNQIPCFDVVKLNSDESSAAKSLGVAIQDNKQVGFCLTNADETVRKLFEEKVKVINLGENNNPFEALRKILANFPYAEKKPNEIKQIISDFGKKNAEINTLFNSFKDLFENYKKQWLSFCRKHCNVDPNQKSLCNYFELLQESQATSEKPDVFYIREQKFPYLTKEECAICLGNRNRVFGDESNVDGNEYAAKCDREAEDCLFRCTVDTIEYVGLCGGKNCSSIPKEFIENSGEGEVESATKYNSCQFMQNVSLLGEGSVDVVVAPSTDSQE